MSVTLARCDLCGVYWQPEAVADALTCRNTQIVCVDAAACSARRELAASLTRIANTRRRKDDPVDPIIVTTVRLYRDDAGEYRWQALAANSRSVAVAGEGYHNFADALRPAASFFPNATVYDGTGHVADGMNAADAFASLTT